MNTIRLEPVIGDMQGIRTLFLVPTIPDDAPGPVREGLARRRLATISGLCPCGARRPKLSRQQLRWIRRKGADIHHLAVLHEPDCMASDDNLATLIQAA